jgi:hypothetical protein
MRVKRRDKLVYFRISEEEFEEILKACHAKGARSVSDLARAAVQEFIKSPAKESEQQMTDFLGRLQMVADDLKQSIQQLVSTVVSPSGTTETDCRSDRAEHSAEKAASASIHPQNVR